MPVRYTLPRVSDQFRYCRIAVAHVRRRRNEGAAQIMGSSIRKIGGVKQVRDRFLHVERTVSRSIREQPCPSIRFIGYIVDHIQCCASKRSDRATRLALLEPRRI